MLELAGTQTTQTGGKVVITQPATAPAGGWATFTLRACIKNSINVCKDPSSCTVDNTEGAESTTCPVEGLEPDTLYVITVRLCVFV